MEADPLFSKLAARAERIQSRLDALAAISETGDGKLTRTFGTDAMRRANALVGEWMRDAGLRIEVDAIGNLRGFQPRDAETADAVRPLLLLGSHLDSVREAGRFDGPLGVILALECAQSAVSGEYGALPFRIGVIGFSDEEGARFQSSYLGSEALAGEPFAPERLALVDAAGVTLEQAIRDMGGDPVALGSAAIHQSPESEGGITGYCEVHIEQGPILEAENIPVGIVSSIAGQSRYAWEIVGQAGHAGTTPMHLRKDALTAAAEFILMVERFGHNDWSAAQRAGFVATVGQLAVFPGAGNVIPGRVTGSLDVRSPDDAIRIGACNAVRELADGIAHRRKVDFSMQLVQEHAATPCDDSLRGKLVKAVEACGYPVRELTSGAGHDAVALASTMPVAMLFVRCRNGLSHHPDEFASVKDIAVALNVMDKFLLSHKLPPPSFKQS